jgi:hypothetical protein
MAKEFMYQKKKKKKNGGVMANEANMDVKDAKQIRDHAMIN